MHKTSGDMSFVNFFFHTVVIIRKTVKSAKNTIIDTCAQNSRRYEFSHLFAHTVVITEKKSNQLKTRFLTIVLRAREDMSFLIFLFKQLLISRKNVKSAKNTIWDICAHNSWSYELCNIFAHTVVLKPKNGQISLEHVL